MLPCVAKTLSQEGTRHWQQTKRNTIYICGCEITYYQLWREALYLAHRHRSSLQKDLHLVYAMLQRGLLGN